VHRLPLGHQRTAGTLCAAYVALRKSQVCFSQGSYPLSRARNQGLVAEPASRRSGSQHPDYLRQKVRADERTRTAYPTYYECDIGSSCSGRNEIASASQTVFLLIDRTEKCLGQKDPSLTSPSLLYEAMITPLGDTFESVSVKAAGMVPSPNNRLPFPSVTGNTFNHNWSAKSFANKV
jgi:hypothetical protein